MLLVWRSVRDRLMARSLPAVSLLRCPCPSECAPSLSVISVTYQEWLENEQRAEGWSGAAPCREVAERAVVLEQSSSLQHEEVTGCHIVTTKPKGRRDGQAPSMTIADRPPDQGWGNGQVTTEDGRGGEGVAEERKI